MDDERDIGKAFENVEKNMESFESEREKEAREMLEKINNEDARKNGDPMKVAYTQVWNVIDFLPEEDKNRIPETVRKTIEENGDKEYIVNVNKLILNPKDYLTEEAKSLLLILQAKYLEQDPEKKRELMEKINGKLAKAQKEEKERKEEENRKNIEKNSPYAKFEEMQKEQDKRIAQIKAEQAKNNLNGSNTMSEEQERNGKALIKFKEDNVFVRVWNKFKELFKNKNS